MSGSDPGTAHRFLGFRVANSTDKSDIRRRLLAERKRATTQSRRQADDELLRQVMALVADVRPADALTITAYVPAGSEPGSTAILDALAARMRVLLPVIDPDGDAPLRWAPFRSVADLIPGPFGISQPVGPVEPTEVARDARWMVIPALAVDRTGRRLGRGGGHYDRTLAALGRRRNIIAVVNDDEVFEELPGEPHDVAVTHIVTSGRGLFAAESPESAPRSADAPVRE